MADYFTLTRRPDPDKPGGLVTAATISCGLCNRIIAGMGGPDPGAICERCAKLLVGGCLCETVPHG